jgi:hypothetical protein
MVAKEKNMFFRKKKCSQGQGGGTDSLYND